MKTDRPMLFPKLESLCVQLSEEFAFIATERKLKLEQLSNYLREKYQKGEMPKLVVICTHNSRRSHLGQLWVSAAAMYYDLPGIESYSGGTEATAFFPEAVAAAQRAGFQVVTEEATATNPKYAVKWYEEQTPYIALSKRYDAPTNPSSNFAAIMVCTSADEGCPFVAGCDFRLALPFDDPKAFDNTSLAAEKYSERLNDIGREMLYVMYKTKY